MKIILMTLLAFICISSGQAQEANYRKFSFISDYLLIKDNDTINPFYISKNPITNKAYITYLCWLVDVYSMYPEVFLNAFPGLSQKTVDSLISSRFKTDQIKLLINKSNQYVPEYIFNSKYIDYPVIGITWAQAMNFCKWLSDRYNEALLIDKKVYIFDPHQKGNECFTTESYLAREYAGVVTKDFIDPVTKQARIVSWKDRLFYPAFRLPSLYELELAAKDVRKKFTAYKLDSFLDYWADYYLGVYSYKMKLRVSSDKIVIIETPLNTTMPSFLSTPKEHCLNVRLANVIDIYREYDQKITETKQPSKSFIKNTLGQMPYMLIGEDKDSYPIYVNRVKYEESQSKSTDSTGVFTIFRFAVNAVKK